MKRIYNHLNRLADLVGLLSAYELSCNSDRLSCNSEHILESLSELLRREEVEGKWTLSCRNVFGEHDFIYLLEQMLIDKDDNGRRFILSGIFDEYDNLFFYAGKSTDIMAKLKDQNIDQELYYFIFNIDSAVRFATGYICLFCKDLGLNPETLAGYEIDECVLNYWVSVRRSPDNSQKKYETMPATHRRAAVMTLIDKSGLCKNIDRTKKAAFVEAVTGGNINANPKDTVSYRKPEQRAIDAASELLKTIGIE